MSKEIPAGTAAISFFAFSNSSGLAVGAAATRLSRGSSAGGRSGSGARAAIATAGRYTPTLSQSSPAKARSDPLPGRAAARNVSRASWNDSCAHAPSPARAKALPR